MKTMQTCLITTVTMTLAMKGKRLLAANGIAAEISRLPPKLTASGCAWGISIDCSLSRRAKEIMEVSNFSYGKIVYADGMPVSLAKEGSAPPAGVTGTPRTSALPKEGGRR